MKAKKTAVFIAVAIAIVATVLFVLRSTPLAESIKREGARLFEVEYIPNQQVDIAACAAAGAADSIYADFRKKYRFHYQTIGMASFADSSRMILLSDLPPHFETDSIASLFARFTHESQLRKHHIGYDGYTTDAIILLGNATQDNCDRLIKRLSQELFFSDYKPTVTTLPAEHKRQYFAEENIDYQITLEEFNTWFIEEGEGFISLNQTDSSQTVAGANNPDPANVMTISQMFSTRQRGVFFSQEPGFVAWAMAKNADIGEQLGNIRQFTLDADLILGALADSTTLVIIGRERQAPLHELPPLQIESILLLASTTEKELSQSLDINDLMAGKMCNLHDWCPTYLSRELENTEFGDLMTITDVLLKDWSERGTIKESHYRYPEPGYYPFDKPLFRKLGLDELVYNWNTAGAMYAIDREGYTIYTLGRTGSLPVSYFNSQQRSQSVGHSYESQAYHYFATLGCTDLARVVQYTALYQLFTDNNISYSGDTYPSFPKNKPFLLMKPTMQLLDTLRQLSSQRINELADSLASRSFHSYQKEHVDKQLSENEQKYKFAYTEENIDQIYDNVHRNTKASLCRSLTEVKNMLCGLSDEKYRQLARFLSYPRGVTIRDRESYTTWLQARRVNRLMREVGKNNLDLIGMDLGKVKNYFAANLSGNSGRYMKTSSLIVTYNDMLTTGGHNLSSRINRVNRMTGYKQGGSRTPSDYEKPSPPPSSQKQPASKPIATSHNKAANSKAGIKKTKQAVRPRSDVIPKTRRTKRGL